MNENDQMILTAGPSITEKEIEYVLDAVKNGWNENWNSYLTRFEKAFADYIGVKYALATSSCTGAIHLALLACGIKEGDEVILPDLAWVAPANAVKYLGGFPVFVDVEPDTWCLDPEKVREALSDKTKAIIPVHLFGHPCAMQQLKDIAREYDLFLLEDAAQAIGSLYQDRRPGCFGHAGVFSFQGAKIMVTGEGGMLVTDDQEFYEKARFYNDHGRDPKGSFWIHEVGYKYKMSNLQAALGCAQLERIDELVEKKRLVYSWYSDQLKNLLGIKMNVQKEGVLNNYWMTSIVLEQASSDQRDGLRQILKDAHRIDTRSFYYSLSEFDPFEKRYDNPVCRRLSASGINLPSGYDLSEEQVSYICKAIEKELSIMGFI